MVVSRQARNPAPSVVWLDDRTHIVRAAGVSKLLQGEPEPVFIFFLASMSAIDN